MSDAKCARLLMEASKRDVEALRGMGDASDFAGLNEYTPYAVQFRYEALGSDAEPLDRQAGLTLVESLLTQVQLQFGREEGA